MSDADKYLSRLDEIRKKGEEESQEITQQQERDYQVKSRNVGFRKARRAYREAQESLGEDVVIKEGNWKREYGGRSATQYRARELLRANPDEKRSEISAAAYNLLNREIKDIEDFNLSLLGAELYEKIGKGKKAIPRLLNALKSTYQTPPPIAVSRESRNNVITKQVKEFIERNTGKRKQAEGGLESRTHVFVPFLLVGLGLSAFSLTLTGNVVLNLTGTTQGLLGIFLFVFGLAGLVFSRKR